MVTAPSMTTLLLMIASGARHRIGIAGRGADTALTVHVPPNAGEHIIDHLAAFAPVFGVPIEGTDFRPELNPSPEAARYVEAAWDVAPGDGNGPRVVVNVSAGKPARNWPDRSYAEVISHLRERYGARCVVIGAPGEWERVEGVARAAGVPARRTPDFDHVVALVDAADFLFTPDTSLAHVASAVRTPAVVLYLRGTARMWGLYGAEGIEIEAAAGTLADLPLDDVLPAVDRVLRRVTGGSRPPALPD
jgi:ADP-heptose:LPS heptosyltransferase